MIEGLAWGDEGFADEFLVATGLVIRLALASLFFGLILGFIGAAAKLSKSRAARVAADVYTTCVRGLPELLVIWIVFFGSSILIQQVYALFAGDDVYFEIDAFASGTIALSLVFGAFATEAIRGAFLAVPRGQVEAAKAAGMGQWLTFRRIQLPQVTRYALPALGNLWVVLIKDTALISVVALDEIIRTARVAGEFYRQPFTFYLTAALIYLALTTVSMIGQARLEKWSARGVRRA